MYSHSLGLSSSTGAGLVAGFNFSSAVGRIACGFLCDILGPLNTLFLSLLLCGISMTALWPVSNSLASLIVFVIINGASNGGFFATMPTVVGNVFGSARVAVAMGMIVTGWAGGYLMVIYNRRAAVIGPWLIFKRALQLPVTYSRLMAGQKVDCKHIVLRSSMRARWRLGLLVWWGLYG